MRAALQPLGPEAEAHMTSALADLERIIMRDSPRALNLQTLQLIAEKVRRASSLAVLVHGTLGDGPAADAISVADDLLADALSMLEDLALPPAAVVPFPAAKPRAATR